MDVHDESLRMENRLGARVLGSVAVEKIEQARLLGELRYGPRVIEAETPSVAVALPPPPLMPEAHASLKELRAVLDTYPQLLDQLIEAEGAREEPRRGAYAAFLASEQAHAARADVIERLESQLAVRAEK